MEVTIGDLIDQLSVVNIKIYVMVDEVEQHLNKVEDAWKMNALVKQRSELRNAINKKLGDRQEIKVYATDNKQTK